MGDAFTTSLRALLVVLLVCTLSAVAETIPSPGQFTYWGPGPFPYTFYAADMNYWLDHETGLMYRYGGRALGTFFTPYLDDSMWYLNLTALNSTTRDFEPQWTMIRNSTQNPAPAYAAGAGDPGSAAYWPGGRYGSGTCVDKISVPGDTLLWLWGGSGTVGWYIDLWYYSVNDRNWRFMAGPQGQFDSSAGSRASIPAGHPGLRRSQLYMNPATGNVQIFGEKYFYETSTRVGEFFQTFEYDVETLSWVQLSTGSGVPSTHPYEPHVFQDGDYVYAVGQYSVDTTTTILNTALTARYRISTNSWSVISPVGGVPAIGGGTLLANDPRSRSVFVWGSSSNDNKIHRFNMDSLTWSVLSNGGEPVFSIYGKANATIQPSNVVGGAGANFGGRLYLHGGDGPEPQTGEMAFGFIGYTALFTYDILCPQNQSVNSFSNCVCAAGTYKSGSNCVQCAVGNTSLPNSNTCDLCPENSFGEISNATLLPVCSACPVGFVSDAGATNCTATSLDTCPLQTTCSRCTARLCSWCNGTCQADGSNTTCIQICPRPPPPPVAPPVAPPVGPPVFLDPCARFRNCSSCAENSFCVWSLQFRANGACYQRNSSFVAGPSVFFAPTQCEALCSPASTCVECGQRYAKGCGWCRSPSTGGPRCMLTTTRSCTTLLTLSPSGCHDFFSCTVRASPSIVGSNIVANLNVVLKYMGLGSAQYTWNVTATYRSATGAIVDTRRILSSATRFLPALAPSSSPIDISWSESITIPTNANGIPDVFVSISPSIIVLASGRLSVSSSTPPLFPFARGTPTLTMNASPRSAFVRTPQRFSIGYSIADTSPSSFWTVTTSTWSFASQPFNPSFSSSGMYFDITESKVTSVGSVPLSATFTFTTPNGIQTKTITTQISFFDVQNLKSDSLIFSKGQVSRKGESGVQFAGGYRFSIGNTKDALIPLAEGKYEWLFEMGFNFGYDSGGIAFVEFEASLTIKMGVVEGSGGAVFKLDSQCDNGVWYQRERSFSAFLDIRRVFEPKIPSFIPSWVAKRIKLELSLGGGIKVAMAWRAQRYADSSCKPGSGVWRRCGPIEITPYISARASVRGGSGVAGFEASAELIAEITFFIDPTSFGNFAFAVKLQFRAWALCFSGKFSYDKKICVVGNCRRDALEPGLSPTEFDIPLKPTNPGYFIETRRPSDATQYVIVEDYVDVVSYPCVRSNSGNPNVGLVVYAYKPANDTRPKNFRLRSTWIRLDNSTGSTQVAAIDPQDVEDLFNNDYSDTNPALAWLPGTTAEYALVWTRLKNASFVNTAPVDANGSIPLSLSEVVRNLGRSELMWGYFRPGASWVIKGSLTSSSSGTISAGARFSETGVVHPTNQPLLLAYEDARVSFEGEDFVLNESSLHVHRFDPSTVNMSLPVSFPVPNSASRLLVSSFNYMHLISYVSKDTESEQDSGFLRFLRWNTSSSNPTNPTIMSSAGPFGIRLPACPNDTSVSNLISVPWPRNLAAAPFVESDLVFLVSYTCQRDVYFAFVDPAESSLPEFQKLADSPAGNISTVSYTVNGTHLILTWAAQEPEIQASAYFIRTVPFAQAAPFPPTPAAIENSSMLRRSRPTFVEDSLSVYSIGESKLVAVSMEDLFNISPLDTTSNGTSRVVSRRIIGAIIDYSSPADAVHSIICYSGTFILSDTVGPAMSANCTSTVALDAVQFTAKSGPAAGDETILLGQAEIAVPVGNFTVEVPVDTSIVEGNSATIIPEAEGVQMLKQVYFATPSFSSALRIVPDSVVQVGAASPIQIDVNVVNNGLRSAKIILRAYSDSQNGIFIGEIADPVPLAFNNQRVVSLLLWGIPTAGEYSVRVALFDSENSIVPVSQEVIELNTAPSFPLLLAPSSVGIQANGFIPVSLPAGVFRSQRLQLYSHTLDQVIDSVEVSDFSAAKTVQLNASTAGPFSVFYAPSESSATMRQLLTRTTVLPVPRRVFAPYTPFAGAVDLPLDAPATVLVSSPSQLLKYVVRLPTLTAPWGIYITSSSSATVVFTTSTSDFVPGTTQTAMPKSTRLSSSESGLFYPFQSGASPSRLNVAVSAASPANVTVHTRLAQFFDLDRSVSSLSLDAGAPAFFTVRPTVSGNLRLFVTHEIVGARIYASQTNFVTKAGQGAREIAGNVLRYQSQFITYDSDPVTGMANNSASMQENIETSFVVPVVADSTYYLSMYSNQVGGGLMTLQIDSGAVSPKQISGCAIDPFGSAAVPTLDVIRDERSNYTEIRLSFLDEDTKNASAAFVDATVQFSSEFGLTGCDWYRSDPLMPAQWTISTQIVSSSCQRLVYTRFVPANVLAECLSYGSATLKRSYRVPGTSNLQILSTTIETIVQIAPVAPPAVIVTPPVTYPTLEFAVTRQLSSTEGNSLRGAIALSMDMQISASDVVLSGPGVGGKRTVQALAVTATLTGPYALQAYQQSFGADPLARALQLQGTINAVPSLSGLVTLVNPSLTPSTGSPLSTATPTSPPTGAPSSTGASPSGSSVSAPTDSIQFQTSPAVVGLLAFVTVFVILVIIALVIVAVIFYYRRRKTDPKETPMATVNTSPQKKVETTTEKEPKKPTKSTNSSSGSWSRSAESSSYSQEEKSSSESVASESPETTLSSDDSSESSRDSSD